MNNKQVLRNLAGQADTAAVPTLERALGHRNPEIRSAAVAALRERGEAGIYALLRAAAHGNRLQRQEAVACLGALRDVRALRPLLASLANERRERRSRSVGRFCLAAVVTCFSVGAAAPLWAETFHSDAELQVCAAEALGNLGDVRALLPLIRLGREARVEVCKAARDALCLLLPRVAELTPEQARSLGPHVIPELASLLSDHDSQLVRLTIAALHAIGDGQAIPEVARLAAAPDRPYLHAEAKTLLAALTERARQEQLRTTLLRGSRPSALAGAGHLLRPSDPQQTPHETSSTAQLLRPVGEDS